MRKIKRWLALAAASVAWVSVVQAQSNSDSYLNFETIPRRAVAISPDGERLFVTNTPAGTLHVFKIVGPLLLPIATVPVGLEPIAVAARSRDEAWVVNHLSDSVSVVKVNARGARVVQTLFVGDEPRDIVFAGPRRGGQFSRAFITAARRGQNHPADTFAEQRRPGVGRADLWVFDADKLGAKAGGQPLTIVNYFADKQGPLATTPDGSKVFAAAFTSGNDTTVITEFVVCGSPEAPFDRSRQNDGPCGSFPGGVAAPNQNQVDGTPNPKNGIIVKFNRAKGKWLDSLGRDWSAAVPFSLPDNDVFAIDALAATPKPVQTFKGVGTLNFGLAVHPRSGSVYVANTEAINGNRFLSLPTQGLVPNPNGKVKTADPATGRTLNGHLYESRISILRPNGTVLPRHLNKHIDYEVVPAPPGVKELSVANPNDVLFSKDGETLYVVALGSNKIVPFRTRELDDNSFIPGSLKAIELKGGGPSSAVLDADGDRMFVYSRFDDSVAVVDLRFGREITRTRLASPEPKRVTEGRPFFYDALLTSSNGEANCAVCHPAGDKDDLAWDFGTPFLGLQANPNNILSRSIGIAGQPKPSDAYNPLKGPMTALTLRGIADTGPLLWQGDGTNDRDPNDVRANFASLNVLFPALLGRHDVLDPSSLNKLASWGLSIVPPPNPLRNLDNSLTPDQQRGFELFTGPITDTLGADTAFACSGCHVIDPARRFFGTRGDITFDNESQNFKVTQLRTVYDKVGMFGPTVGGPPVGDQVRGIGTSHNGSLAGPEAFTSAAPFDPLTDAEINQLGDFMLVFPSNLAPIVGQQVTLAAGSGSDVRARVDLLEARARADFITAGRPGAKECELVVHGQIRGKNRGLLYRPSGRYVDERGNSISSSELRQLARVPGQELTYTCWYPGAGRRAAFAPTGSRGLLDRIFSLFED